jgi:hypothetical protein
MTISKTTNGADVTDNYGTQGATGSAYDDQTFVISKVVTTSARAWDETGESYFGGELGALVTVRSTGADDVTVTGDTDGWNVLGVVDRSSTSASVWQAFDDDDNGHLEGGGHKVPAIGNAAPTLAVVTFGISGDEFGPAAGQTDVHGFALRERHESPMPTGEVIQTYITPAIHDLTDLGDGTISAFDENMPCSSYLMKVLLSGNANAIAYSGIDQLSFPVVGVGSSL